LPALLSVRQEHAVVALGGEIYVIGGFTPNVTATVEAFAPESGSWRSVADFPVALHHANAAAVDGKLIVAGFYLGASFTGADGRVFELDPAVGSWSERGVMPAGTERASSCVAAFDGKVYLFGGARAGSVADASAYDVAANSWQELPPLPEAREHCVAGEIDGTLYIAAGRSNGIGGFEPRTWAFDPLSATYAPRDPITTPRGGAAGAVAGGRLYVFGGEGNNADPSGVFANVEAYDPVTDSWQALPAMLEPRHGLGAAALADDIYLPGGAATQGFGAASDHTVMRFDATAP
jgi:N-acetylneuraminic acid mutarotase